MSELRMGLIVSRWFLLLLLLPVGCDQPVALPPEPSPAPSPVTGTQFVAQQTGRLHGQLTWKGPLPAVSALESVDHPLEVSSRPVRPRINPNQLRLAGDRRGLTGAFVWLEGVDPARAPPWNPSPATLVMHGQQFTPERLFLRQGDPLTLQSRDRFHHTLQARGAQYFSVTLPNPDVPRTRTMAQSGVVEVRSGSGAFWARAYVLVQPHPYMALTDEQGHFSFDQVPAGRYQLHAWHANPLVVQQERSPDTRRIVQVCFDEPFTAQCPVVVEAGQTTRPVLSLGGVR
jgi:hypothetical protein